MTSICNNPKNPQRKPKPSAADVSASKLKDASFNDSFSNASRSPEKSFVSTGNNPQNTTGTDGANPGKAASHWRRSSVMVSPTLASATRLTPALIKPISPGPKASSATGFGANTPTRSITCVAPVAIMRIFIPFFSTPWRTRTNVITPR